MTTKRRKLVAIVLLAVISGAIACWLLRQSDEPEYQGRRLSEWLAQYEERNYGDDEAQAAVRNIGTNALPCLLKWIGYEPPAWQMALSEKLPSFIANNKMVARWLGGEANRRATTATWSFNILGTNAVNAIPELKALMKDATKPDGSSRAICALGTIGEPAIPVLRAGLADSNQPDRERIVTGFRLIAHYHGIKVCLPTLLEALNHDDLSVRSAATNAVRDFAPEAFTNAPPR